MANTSAPAARPAPEKAAPRRMWTWNLGALAGIPIRVHITMLLLLAWLAVAYTMSGLGPAGTIVGIVLVGLVFAIVVIHELGHALMARRFGVKTRDILLLPIGGIASLERIPDRPRQELAIALVGPAINVVLALALWGVIALAGWSPGLGRADSITEALIVQLLWINVILAGFNLLPAFPLDGGRALRAFLAMMMSRERATTIAAGLGKLLAIAFAVFGLFYNPWLVLIALVVWFGARRELESTRMRSSLTGVPARAAMRGHVETLRADEPLETAAAIMVNAGATALPIVDHGRLLGVMTSQDVVTGVSSLGGDASVGEAPRHPVVVIDPGEPLDRVLDVLERAPEAIAVVVDHGTPIGVVTPEQLASYVSLHPRREVSTTA